MRSFWNNVKHLLTDDYLTVVYSRKKQFGFLMFFRSVNLSLWLSKNFTNTFLKSDFRGNAVKNLGLNWIHDSFNEKKKHTHTHKRVGRVGSHSWSTECLGFIRFAKRHQALTKKKTQLHDHSTMEHKNRLKFQNSVFQNKFTHIKYPHIENYICLSPTVFIVFLPIEVQRRLK